MKRCSWCSGDKLYQKYHDEEWGVPVYNDKVLFEFLILEGAQAGLSWITILKRREAYRRAFCDWDFKKVALFSEADVERLMRGSPGNDSDEPNGIIRNRLKINSAVNNAKVFIEIRKEFGSFSKYIWGFVGGKVVYRDGSEVKSELSERISADLVRRGMKFVGPVIIYAYLEAVGILCNHERECFKRKA